MGLGSNANTWKVGSNPVQKFKMNLCFGSYSGDAAASMELYLHGDLLLWVVER